MAEHKKITIGCDPEFTVISGIGEKHYANNYLPQGAHGGEVHEIGCDGHAQTGELRPKPHDCPLKLVEEIAGLITKMKSKMPATHRCQAGHCPNNEFTGGHIHFNISPDKYDIEEFLKLMDMMVAVPVLCIAHGPSFTKRVRGSPFASGSGGSMYGRLSDYRTPSHGGIEYRTLGSWLCNKDMAESILCMAYVVADAFVNDNWRISSKLYDMLIDDEKYSGADKEYYRPIALQTYKYYKGLPLFKKYERQIKRLFMWIAQGRTWNEKRDMYLEWGAKTETDYMCNLELGTEKHLDEIFKDFKYKKTPNGLILYVYGVSNDNDYDICVGNTRLWAVLQKSKELKSAPEIVSTIASRGEKASKYPCSVGFTLSMRTKHPELCARIVRILLEADYGVEG